MFYTKTHAAKAVINPGATLIERELRGFRARVGLALATSDFVLVDLTRTEHLDSWALLAIVELAENFAPRLTFATSAQLRQSLLRVDPDANLDGTLKTSGATGHDPTAAARHTERQHSPARPLERLRDSSLRLADSSDDIRGDRVIDRHGSQIGRVAALFIDAAGREVRMLEVCAGGFLGFRRRHFILGVEAITRVRDDEVYVDQHDRVVESSVYDPALVPETRLYGSDVDPIYWATCGMYPAFFMLPDDFESRDGVSGDPS